MSAVRKLASLLLIAALGLLLAGPIAAGGGAQSSANPITITPSSPLPGSQIDTLTPNITVTYSDANGTIDPGSVFIVVNGVNVTSFDGVRISAKELSYQVPSIFKLRSGNNTVNISVSDTSGHTNEISFGFATVAGGSSSGPLLSFNLEGVVIDIALGAVVCLGAFGGYILYIKRTRRFAFYKYFATHPVNKEYLVLVVPLIIAVFVILFGLTYVLRTPGLPLLAPEYVVIAGFFVAITAFTVDSNRELTRLRAFERSFAQFLFEMADAMRGGLDPAKALLELSTTHQDILKKPLKVAADGVRIGRPFDQVLRNMAVPMKSPLITRYAELIADASTIGGETASVIHRAAKDLDDFIKIDLERRNALVLPIAVLYVAFGVLMAVLFSLLSIAPSLGGVSLTFFSGGGGNPLSSIKSGGTAAIPKLAFGTLEQRFFDLMMINSIGTGIIIGAFTEGKARYGLTHSIVLLIVTIVAFLYFA
ncbi:MAG: type II secretion system F family protein [Thermoplasmata archaeon]|nr:type II secretion system F family protein [Thermoplasmata archaeon]